ARQGDRTQGQEDRAASRRSGRAAGAPGAARLVGAAHAAGPAGAAGPADGLILGEGDPGEGELAARHLDAPAGRRPAGTPGSPGRGGLVRVGRGGDDARAAASAGAASAAPGDVLAEGHLVEGQLAAGQVEAAALRIVAGAAGAPGGGVSATLARGPGEAGRQV